MKIIFLSDTHNLHNQVQIEPCDILIHAGDFTNMGYRGEHDNFVEWFEKQPAKHRVLVGGNHDFHLHTIHTPNVKFIPAFDTDEFKKHGIIYLEDELVSINGINIYGSPWTPKFGDWAFMMPRETIGYMWDMIPDDVDILVTHGPPYGVLDQPWGDQEHVGCKSLLDKVKQIQPKYHFWGHIHGSYGSAYSTWNNSGKGTNFYNVSVVGEDYKVQNKPVTIEV